MMKLNNLLIGNLIFIFLLVSVYFIYTNLSIENNTIVSYMNDINSKQFNDNVSFNDKELYTIANIHQYGRYHNSIDVNKAIDMYHLSIDKSNDKTHIGNCYLSLGHLYKDENIGEKAIFYYLLALKYGYEESIINIGKIYLYGLHPHYLPEKIIAGHIFNTFMNVSDTVEPWCKLYLKEINELGYHDIDAYTINKIEYKHLPNDIVRNIRTSLEQRANVMIPYTQKFNKAILKDDGDYDDIHDVLKDIPQQIILNDTQNVHDHTLQNMAKNVLSDLSTYNNTNFINNVQELYKIIETTKNKNTIIKVCESLSSYIHSKYDKSEQDVFNVVWKYISNHENTDNLITMFIYNLESCIENDIIVCSTGKIIRMLSTLDVLDTNTQNLKSEWMIKDEIANITSVSMKSTLDKCTYDERIAYNELNPTPKQTNFSNKISETIRNKIVSKCKTDYIDTNIISQEQIDIYLIDYLNNV
jgi:hypothetical protein